MASDVKITISAIDKTKSAFDGIGGAIGKMGKIAAGVAIGGIAALAAGLAFSVKAAMEAEEIQAQLEAVLKSTGGAAGMTADAINDMAMELSRVTRFEDDAIVAGQNILLTFTKIGKDVFPEATEVMLDMSTALGQDLQSSAIQLGKALNDPVQGITALQRVGVSFTDEQKKMVQAMVDAGDVMGAQKFILQELQTEFGGSAKAAGETFAGQLDILKNNLGNVAENIGMKLLPLLTPFVEKINGLASAFFEAGLDSVEFQDELANLFGEEIAQGIHDLIVWLGVNIPVAIQALSNMWTGTLQPALKVVWAFIKNTVIPILIDIYAWLSVNVPAAIAVLGEWLGKLRAWWAENGDAIIAKAKEIWNRVSDAITNFIAWITPKITAFLAAIKAFWDDHGAQIIAAVQAMWDGVKRVWETFKAAWETLMELFHLAQQGKWEEFGAKIREILDAAWAAIKEAAKKAIEAIKKFFTETDWGAVGSSILQGIADGITAGAAWLIKAAKAAAKAAYDAAIGFLTGGGSGGGTGGGKGKDDIPDYGLPSMTLGNMLMGNGIGPWAPPVGIPPGNLKWPTKFLRGAPSKKYIGSYPGRTGVDMTDNQELKDMLKRMMSFFEGGVNQYNLTINEAGQRGNIIMDFALLQALARG